MGGSAGAADRCFVFYIWTADANAKLLAKTVTGYIKLSNTQEQYSHVAFFVVLKTIHGASEASISRVKRFVTWSFVQTKCFDLREGKPR